MRPFALLEVALRLVGQVVAADLARVAGFAEVGPPPAEPHRGSAAEHALHLHVVGAVLGAGTEANGRTHASGTKELIVSIHGTPAPVLSSLRHIIVSLILLVIQSVPTLRRTSEERPVALAAAVVREPGQGMLGLLAVEPPPFQRLRLVLEVLVPPLQPVSSHVLEQGPSFLRHLRD